MFHKPIITEIPILKWYKGVDKPVDKVITPISDRGVKMDEKLIVYRVGFNNGDETEVDARSETEAIELAKTIATESGVEFEFDYVESCGYKISGGKMVDEKTGKTLLTFGEGSVLFGNKM